MSADPILVIEGLTKTYANGFQALKGVSLEIARGEIFALLGPNGAGKSTLINIVCGLARASGGRVSVDGCDIGRDWRRARSAIGLVPQEMAIEAYESVLATVRYSRGLNGCAPDEAYLEQVLRDLSLWEKRNDAVNTLSGGMKRRVLIAKALSHRPGLLFLDEPTAGVDVELRRDLWALVRRLREEGVTIVLTTHYIEEAEEMADRVGVINHGELILVRDKAVLMRDMGSRRLNLTLAAPMAALPPRLAGEALELIEGGRVLSHVFDPHGPPIAALLRRILEAGVEVVDVSSEESSLEEIFVSLVKG
jgi:ABC-2 type transport system ATP-binding protein